MSDDLIFQNVRRNASCPCGSGKRFKFCHGKASKQHEQVLTQSTLHYPFQSDDLFCAIEGNLYSLDEKQYIFVANQSDARIQIDKATLNIIRTIESFATFNEHFLVCSKIFGIQEKDFLDIITSLKQHKLLILAESFINTFIKTTDNTSVNSKFAGICIRTCESPSYLKRILDSQIRRKRKFGENEEVFVFDDSSSDQAIEKNKEIINNASKDINVSYFGIEWQEDFVDILVNEFPENKSIIKKLLLPQTNVLFSGGRLMNLALLFFAGKHYLNFDDDFILDDVRTHPCNSNDYIQIGARPDRIYDGYNDENQVLQTAGTPLDIDPLSWHKKSLGASLSELSAWKNDLNFHQSSLSGLHNTRLNRYKNDSFVVTSGNGWFGTSGKRDGRFIFAVSYKNISPPWIIAENFEQLLAGGYCWDSIVQTEIVAQGFSTPAGINNSRLLAPTISTCKGEDTLLCTMTKNLYPNSVHLGYSWALAHFRVPKMWKDDTFNKPKPMLLPDLISSISKGILFPDNASNYDRLLLLADAIYEVSKLSDKLFQDRFLSDYFELSISTISSLYKQAETISDSKYKSIIERMITNDLTHLFVDKTPAIEDAIGENSLDQIKWAKKDLRVYSEGLMIWSKLWDYCNKNNLT